jgi:hypothetical protein
MSKHPEKVGGDIYDCLEDIRNMSCNFSIEENEYGYFWKYKQRISMVKQKDDPEAYQECTSITQNNEVYDTPESCITGLAMWLDDYLRSVEDTFASYIAHAQKCLKGKSVVGDDFTVQEDDD